ncbi:histidine phosphatase family protein [Kitasatospora sp. NPDC097605]|uniref:SixA phosphatase family protein n=1 Tax=Kitasatospora sp. NPDC097605 TaxID=3157226 RepID=UPI0033300BD1
MTADDARRIVLIRHAQAERETVVDHERRLDERGRTEAALAGRWLAASGVLPGLARVSSARRTGETWELVRAALPEPPETVHERRIYDISVDIHRREAGVDELIAILRETPEGSGDLVVVGHHPSLHDLVAVLAARGRDATEDGLSRQVARTGFPTAAVAVLAVDGPWRSLGPGRARLTGFWAPAG